MIARPTTRGHRDSGFTLPEVLVTTLVMALVVGVLVGVFSVVMRNTPTTEARAQDARSTLGLVTWLPQDVDSTPSNGFDTDPSALSGCGNNDGVSLLRMEWSENLGGPDHVFVSNYRHIPAGDGGRVIRITCSGIGSPPFTNTTTQNVTSELPALPAGWSPGDAPASVIIEREDPLDSTSPVKLVTFELTTFDGDTVRTDSASKNPADTLPTTTTPSWLPPTPTTVVTVNQLPTTVDLSFTAHPGPYVATANLIASDPNGDTIVVSLASVPTDWTVTLTGLKMFIIPAPADVGQTKTIEYIVDDLQGDGVVEGEVAVTVVPTTTATTTTTVPAATTTTTTTVPTCAFVSTSISPASVKNVQPDSHNQGGGNVNVGVLLYPVTVSATTNDHCDGVEIRYDSGGVNTTGFLGLTQTGPNTWEGQLLGRDEGSSETWSDGDHRLYFHDAFGGPYTFVTLEIK